jgi:hypothetical protein
MKFIISYDSQYIIILLVEYTTRTWKYYQNALNILIFFSIILIFITSKTRTYRKLICTLPTDTNYHLIYLQSILRIVRSTFSAFLSVLLRRRLWVQKSTPNIPVACASRLEIPQHRRHSSKPFRMIKS